MNSYRSFLIVLALGTAQSVFGSGVNGGALTPCQAGSLLSYIDGSNTGCALGVLVSTSWALDPGGIGGETGGATLLNASEILVTPTESANLLGGTFTFSGEPGFSFGVGAGQTAQYFINYSYFIDPGPIMDDAQLFLGNDPGNTTVTQFFCNDLMLTTPGPTPGCRLNVDHPIVSPQMLQVTTAMPNASIMFMNPAMNTGAIETDILLDGTNGPTNFAFIASTLNVDGPEPAGVFLALGGLAAIGLGRWYVTRR
jgi:hypothetical protein